MKLRTICYSSALLILLSVAQEREMFSPERPLSMRARRFQQLPWVMNFRLR